jgi:hypothetical protein
MRSLAVWTVATAVLACATIESTLGPGEDLLASRTAAGIEYTAKAHLNGSQVRVDVTIRNTTGQARDVSFTDGCVVLIRAYRGGELVWDQRTVLLCTMAIQTIRLEAGAARTVSAYATAAEILAGGRPSGRYRLEALLRPVGAGEIRLDAGEVTLSR